VDFLQTSEDRGEILNKYKGFCTIFGRFHKFWNFCSMKKSVDQVHGAVNRAARLGPRCREPSGQLRGGALLAQGALDFAGSSGLTDGGRR
jgi:hypothetical protein